MFAIVPRETFLLLCWPLFRSAGLSAALLASLLLCWPLCCSAGLSVALLAFLPLCWLLCRSAALLACCLRFGLPGDSRQPSLCLPVPGVFLLVVTLLPAADLCRLHLLCLHVFSCPAFSSVVHVDILLFSDVRYCLVYVCDCVYSYLILYF
ncbi:hypothetical protein [Thiolapillus sp.]|uniref:hypothetical protein n=1 Tax=Thiolapillus sp. TaxID=2017437 RepID=UPI003AF7610E